MCFLLFVKAVKSAPERLNKIKLKKKLSTIYFDVIGTLYDAGVTCPGPVVHTQMCWGTHWPSLLHSCKGDKTMLPYQEWSKRALLGFYKLLLSKVKQGCESTHNSTKSELVASFVIKSDWNFESWPVDESVIDMDFYWEYTKKNPQNFIVKCITVMNRKHLPRVCCTRSWIFCHLSYFVFLKFRISQAWYKFFYRGFISSLLTFFQRFLFYESAHLEMQYPLRTQERSHMDHVNRG